jgi:hypothetical protein
MEELNNMSNPPKNAADPPKKDAPAKKVKIEEPPKDVTPGEIVENPPMSGGKKKTIPPKTIPADMVKPDDSKLAEQRKAFLSAKKVMLPAKTEAQTKELLKKQGPITEYLKNYKASFSKDLDKIWDELDNDKNGYLDKVESEKFIEEVAGAID